MKYLLTFATLVTAACLTPQKEEAEEDDNEEQEDENGAFSPSEGLWEFSTPALEGDCFPPMEDADTGAEEMEQMNLTVNDNTSFTLTIMDEEENSVLACTRSDMSFTCDPEIIESPIDEEGMMLVQEIIFSGSFSSETALLGSIDVTMSCTGDDCESLEELGIILPCTASGEMDASFVE